MWLDLFALLTVSVHAENSHLSDIKRNTIVMVMPMGFSRILQDSSKILKRGDGISENHQLIDFVKDILTSTSSPTKTRLKSKMFSLESCKASNSGQLRYILLPKSLCCGWWWWVVGGV